ncbi:MAG: fibrobacter succinogenes major paralogous domain-containing protein [Prevotellaceae bacterium]|jgi:hypothetical protein|nr:fibrobacter succinogenes major paralogous domain-containing protein [Prevotellaceae bacterium]
MKTNQFLFAAFTAAFLSVANYAAAQVTIGGTNPPTAGAVLDLNSSVKGGLALSNVSITDLEKIPTGTNLFPGITAGGVGDANDDVNAKLTGTIVYNTNALKLYVSQENSIDMSGRGIYVWDGNRWNKIGAPEHAITFAPYNLGADPTQFNSGEYASLSPAKRQIKYLATCSTAEAVNVWGDLYQWGRVADGHEKRNSVVYTTPGVCPDGDLDANGQVALGKDRYGLFIQGKDESYDYHEYNWRTRKDDLWGNGESVNPQSDDKGGIPYNGDYYFNTDWAIPANNPCASMGAGWRVPTENEWERLINYLSDPSGFGGRIPTDAEGDMPATGQATTSANSAPLTWVPVAGGKVSVGWADSQGNLGGYAIYKTADWTAAIGASGYFDNNGIPDYTRPLYATAAPEPLLFLPAAGARYAYEVSAPGFHGHYWSSTNDSKYSFYMYLQTTEVSASSVAYRAYGKSVRCVKE